MTAAVFALLAACGGRREPAPAEPREPTLSCFSWVHGSDSSTDCYRDVAACERARNRMADGARPTTDCAERAGGACTRISRGAIEVAEPERCFGSAANCERYRAFVAGNGIDATRCAPAD